MREKQICNASPVEFIFWFITKFWNHASRLSSRDMVQLQAVVFDPPPPILMADWVRLGPVSVSSTESGEEFALCHYVYNVTVV